jgi:hypothetical protein
MEIINIDLPPGDNGAFFCPFTGELQMDESGISGPSCVAYIPPPVFADAVIACRHFQEFWDKLLGDITEEMWEQVLDDLEGEILTEYLKAYDGVSTQKLIGFRVKTTSTEPRVTPEFDHPVHTLSFFYVVDFWYKSPK